MPHLLPYCLVPSGLFNYDALDFNALVNHFMSSCTDDWNLKMQATQQVAQKVRDFLNILMPEDPNKDILARLEAGTAAKNAWIQRNVSRANMDLLTQVEQDLTKH